MNQPPDGFADNQAGPPDGFADQQPQQDSLLNRSADAIRGVEGSIGNAIDTITPNSVKMYKASPLYQASPMGLLSKANDYIHQGADWVGEKAATGLASHGANPYAAAAIGTVLQMAPDIAATAATAGSSEIPSSAPSMLEKLGARGINNAAGIRPRTLEGISQGANPSEAGTKLGLSLFKDKSIGNTAGETFNKSKSILGKYGQNVGKAMSDIKGSGGFTESPDYEVLQPLHDAITEMQNSSQQVNRAAAKPLMDSYKKLNSIANDNEGNLSVDHIRNEMQDVGTAMENAGEGTPKEAALSKLYGILAKTRDSIVQRIADTSGNENLSKNLLDANAGYSKYSRIMPDISRNAAKEAVTPPSLFTPVKTAGKAIEPFLSKAAIKTGQALNNEPSVAKVTAMAAPHGKIVEQDGKRYQWDGQNYVEQ